MIQEAAAIVDHTEYMNALHAAEEYLIEEQAYIIPLFSYNTPILKSEKNPECHQEGNDAVLRLRHTAIAPGFSLPAELPYTR